MNPSPANSGNLGLNTIVQSPSTRISTTNSTIVSSISSTTSPINLFTNLSTGLLPASTTSGTNSQGQSASSRLKVEDALSYLDRVKNQFALHPQVYNQFLDIMKEFKSQSIDTQEVINRVSTLFHGHPDLIVGFNTFLPPGYRIEVSDDHYGFIQVTHPSSRTESIALGNLHSHGTLNFSISTPASTALRQTSNLLHPDHEETSSTSESSQSLLNSTSQAVNALIYAANTSHQSTFSTKSTKTSTSSVASPAQPTTTTPTGQPVEFNHAINYVNKIKNRFHQNPNVYKTFLEILHTYQKQQRDAKEASTGASSTTPAPEGGASNSSVILSETEVYAKVADLFNHHEDLLAEFSQFLPDASQQPTERSNSISDILSSSTSDSSLAIGNTHASNITPRVIIGHPISSFVTAPSSSFTILSSNATMTRDERSLSPSAKRTAATVASQKRIGSAVKSPAIAKKKRLSAMNGPSTITDMHISDGTGQNQRLPSMDEIAFFHQVQKTLRSPSVFDNFLRCILLYTKQIVSRVELFGLVHSYLSHAPELLKTFQELINLREPGEVIIPKHIYDQSDSDSMISIDYGSCSQYGKSYRSIPRSYVPPMCSGRSQLCKDVLNDHCVLFPTFTDESSSVSAKKSVFEEHMYKIEDERFELDIVMEVNLSAIRALESVQLHMASLTSEQVNNFQLDDQLGGQSTFTQRQAVQRIYGERATEIIDGLKRNPRVAVPIVLKRLKSKDEEWRESKKNFERFWKEQSEKYYLKSLDYMGMNCKNADARIIRNRHLLTEIESVKDERDHQLTSNNHQPHLILRYEDVSIIDDAAALILFFVQRQVTLGKDDRQHMKKILYQFLPDFLFTAQGELSDDDEGDDDDENESNSKREKKPRITRHSDANRRRNAESFTAKPRQLPPEYQNSNDMFHLFFANDNYYYFFRLHQLLCERLSKIFQQSSRLIEQDNHGQRSRSVSAANALRLANRSNVSVDDYYPVFLDMIRQLLDGTMDSSSYEDALREMFGIHAYTAFTMDKIIHHCVRQLQAIVTEQSSEAIMRLYARPNGTTGLVEDLYITGQQNAEAAYQREMEAYADGNRLFRLCSFKNDRRLAMSLIVIESSEDEEENDEEREKITANGRHYVESYLHTNDADRSEALNTALRARLKKQPRFLFRNLSAANDSATQSATEFVTINNDYCSISAKTLKREPIHRAGFSFYKRGSLRATRQHHRSLALKQYERFAKFSHDWSDKYLSEEDQQDSLDHLWLKTHRSHANEQEPLTIEPFLSNDDEDLRRPPYRHYRHYRLIDAEK